MKTLEELGISPWPWRVFQLNADRGDEYEEVFGVSEKGWLGRAVVQVAICEGDARIIAAAPELYEALAAMLHCAEQEVPWPSDTNMAVAMDMARKALAMAAGEEMSNA